MIRDIYMTTGEFAKLMKIFKHTLFHYDDIQLFSPEIKGDNDYRYYSIYQMETFDTIILLKNTGMSLQEIKDFMENRNPEIFLNIFHDKQKKLDQEIARLQSMKMWMNQKKKKIQYTQECDFSKIQKVYQPERYYLFGDVSEPTDKAFYLQINKLITELDTIKKTCDYEVAYMQFPENIENRNYDSYNNVLLLMKQKITGDNVKVLPSGDYLTAYYVGHWSNSSEAYERLLNYIVANDITTEGNYLEYNVIDNFTAKEISDYVTEISIKIRTES